MGHPSPSIDYSPLQVFLWHFFSLGVGVGAAGPTSGLVIVLILVLAPWCPERIMKEEKRGQGGAQADWAGRAGKWGRAC